MFMGIERGVRGMFRIRQIIKMLLQNVVLPLLYAFFRCAPVRRGSILMADAHHEGLPFSMQRMHEELTQRGYEPELFCADFGKLSFGQMVLFLIRFMRRYATAEYVFICDYFLPAASCKKRRETTLVQLWHSCGLMKKIAFDAGDDIPKGYHGDMFGNYTWMTVSAQVCVPVHAHALRIPEERILATGVSRTDVYFDAAWNERCRERFFREYPQARGKKIAVWAPTFRGNAARPCLAGEQEIRDAAEALRDDWYVVIKAHPHIDAHGRVSNCVLPTEELFAVADLLITDYSSVLFDYLVYQKPVLLFAPDLKEYEKQRGFYLDYRQLPFPLAEDGAGLAEAVAGCAERYLAGQAEIAAFREMYIGACDGHATERILNAVL